MTLLPLDPVAAGDEAHTAAAALAALGAPASPIPASLGKKEVEQFVEQIVPGKFRDRSRLVREICREVMGKQPYERGRHLVAIALRHTLPLFLADSKFVATLSCEPLRKALDPQQTREILDHNRNVILEQTIAFMGNWNPDAIRRLLELPDQLSGVLVFNVYLAVIGNLRRHDPEAEAQATGEEVEREVEELIDKWIHPVIFLPPGVERPARGR